MLRVTVAAVGSLKEQYWRDACGEYIKRLGAFCKPEIIELDEKRLPKNPSAAEIAKCVGAEGDAMLTRLPSGARIIAMCVEGVQLSSERLGAELTRLSCEASHIAFVIGGSHGLSERVKSAAALKLSMGAMTFPHQLARVMLLEQVYRGFSIAAGTKYHK